MLGERRGNKLRHEGKGVKTVKKKKTRGNFPRSVEKAKH